MTTRKRPDSVPPTSGEISADTEDWIRQFLEHFEIHALCEGAKATAPLATARAILATYLDSGMDQESVLALIGQVAIESRIARVGWTGALNRRRFELIDKEIQESLTPAEIVELAGLTRMMRDHVESELNLPMQGARDLHSKLLHIDSAGEPE